MPDEDIDEDTAQPVYRLSVPVFPEQSVQCQSIPRRGHEEQAKLKFLLEERG